MNPFYIEEAQWVKSAHNSSMSLDPQALNECEGIMKKIYHEDPSYWPYGLTVDGHDDGLFLIREASTKKAIGFTGWQKRWENGEKVGYYSIGVLPEYRGNGFAKAALGKLIAAKSASVDKVRAFVMPNNKKSINLANSMGVEVTHEG